jgi:hypothetical protein
VKINYPITSEFLKQETFRKSSHKGVDLYMKTGTDLRSVDDGVVTKIYHLKDNVGNGVKIKFEDGNEAIYGHMNDVTVKVGDTVHTGDLIGHSGHSGHVVSSHGGNGEHLHFGLKNPQGEFIDPTSYMDSLQNMNNPQWIASHAGSVNEIGDKLQTMSSSFSLSDIMSQYMSSYAQMLSEIKFNLINLFTSVDYTVVIHHLQNLLQLFS